MVVDPPKTTMARLRAIPPSTGHRVLIVEDDVQLANGIARLVRLDGHEVRIASNPRAGVEMAREYKPELMLLDYYMPGGTGADVVRELRAFDALCQVILVTGYAADQPARRLLAELDIQGYHDKGDGPERLLVQMDAAFKHHAALHRVSQQTRCLRRVLDMTPDISRIQPVGDLLRTALRSVGTLLDGENALLATENSGLFVLDAPEQGVSVRAGIGGFAEVSDIGELPEEAARTVLSGMGMSRPEATGSGYVVVPIRTRSGDRGCMMVEAASLPQEAVEACQIYGVQVVQALENVLLYERATVDLLTGVYTRAHGLERLKHYLRLGQRHGHPTSVAMLDVDHFKRINDTYGHTAGDLVLRQVASALRAACRTTDLVFRYGGEEFVLVLPETGLAGATRFAERLRRTVASAELSFEGQAIQIKASIGVACASHEQLSETELLRLADEALYRAKKHGRDRVCVHEAPPPQVEHARAAG